MPIAYHGPIQLYYEDHGSPADPPVIFIPGYGAQLTGWVPRFIRGIVKRHIRVITLDNRDAGLSSQLGNPHQLHGNYSFHDMSADVVALADTLDLTQFHVLGQSMGGMIVQQLLSDYPTRIVSAHIFSSTPAFHEEFSPTHSLEAASHEGLETYTRREDAIEATFRRIMACRAGSAYPVDPSIIRRVAQENVDRCYRPDGTARQLDAMSSFSMTTKKLESITAPVSIWHGRSDPFFGVNAPLSLAQHIPSAELHLFPGMAHEFPAPLIPLFIEGVSRLIIFSEKYVKGTGNL